MLFKVVNTVLVILQCGVDGETHLLDHHRLIQVDQDLVPGDIDQIGMKRSIDLKFIIIRTGGSLFKLLQIF